MLELLTASQHSVTTGSGALPLGSRVARRTIYDQPLLDDDVPLFVLVRASLGLPADEQWWPRPEGRQSVTAPFRSTSITVDRLTEPVAKGRHVAALTNGELVVTSSPTIDLLERTLAGLKSW